MRNGSRRFNIIELLRTMNGENTLRAGKINGEKREEDPMSNADSKSNGLEELLTKNGGKTGPPSIPHITNNIIPLSNILKYYSQTAYKQLTNIIDNLSNNQETESDLNRKKAFLQVIISMRQDFVKIYTLVKWASVSKDVSKLIDLLNWFRSQDFFFEQLGFGLNELNRYSGAKLPNSDIITALDVFIKKRPQLPSYNFIRTPPVSPEKILEVFENLNLSLSARLALMDDLPPRFARHFEVQDGRIYFTIPNEFMVSVTAPNDLIIDSVDEYSRSPFYFIDFKFLFGINPDNTLISHKKNKIATSLPRSSFTRLEGLANNVLLTRGLQGLYDLLHRYAISFKLYLLYKQLKDLAINSRWRNNIKYKYDNSKSLLIINYWSNHHSSRNWKSFIELGIDKNYHLNYRWFKNGVYDTTNKFSITFGRSSQTEVTSGDTLDAQDHELPDDVTEDAGDEIIDLNIDTILTSVASKHAEIVMDHLFEKLKGNLASDLDNSCTRTSIHQIKIKLTPRKSAILSLNPLSGFFYFTDPSPIQNQAVKQMNFPSYNNNRGKAFFTEADMIDYCVSLIIQLRLHMYGKEIGNKLSTNEWINNDIISLNEYETAKLFNYSVNQLVGNPNSTLIYFYRCKNWPSSWFLVNMINGLHFSTFWWVARIKSIKGEWKIQWVRNLGFTEDSNQVADITLNYDFFFSLSNTCSNMILDHMILEQLQLREIHFIKSDSRDKWLQALEKHGLSNISGTLFEGQASDSTYESMIILYNNNLIPVNNSSSSLFLLVRLLNLNSATQMSLCLFGKVRNIPNGLSDIADSSIKIKKNEEYFTINDLINLSNEINDNYALENNLLGGIFLHLERLSKLIKILHQLHSNNSKVIENTINSIEVEFPNDLRSVTITLPEDQDSIKLASRADESSEQKLIIDNINRYLEANRAQEGVIGALKYLQEVSSFIKTINAVRSHLDNKNKAKLASGLPKLSFEVAIRSVNLIQFVYYLSYNTGNSKKIFKDKVTINLSFRTNKFYKEKKLYVKLSLKENLHSKNLKHRKLFELVFKAIGLFKVPDGVSFIRLNSDFLIDGDSLEALMVDITDCFIHYMNETN